MRIPLILLALAALPLIAVPAFADNDDWDDDLDCRIAAGAERLPSSKAVAIGESLGYHISDYETDDGCIELKGVDAHGARVKLRLDPVTGAVITRKR